MGVLQQICGIKGRMFEYICKSIHLALICLICMRAQSRDLRRNWNLSYTAGETCQDFISEGMCFRSTWSLLCEITRVWAVRHALLSLLLMYNEGKKSCLCYLRWPINVDVLYDHWTRFTALHFAAKYLVLIKNCTFKLGSGADRKKLSTYWC